MYVYGIRNEKSYGRLLGYLLKYDIISFDIFDTTIIRICNSPTDVFEIVAKEAMKYGINNFVEVRSEAQKLAEKENGISTRLYNIYGKIKQISGLSDEQINVLQKLEIQTESRMCMPNEVTVSLINDLKEKGKKVIFISDMYLDSKMIQDIFSLNDMQIVYDGLFVSCEVGRSKSKGDLFNYVKEQFPGRKIVHVGDYWRSDVYNALLKGKVAAVYYPLNGKGNGKYELFVKNSLPGKANYIYKWAYSEFAPVLWNFCEWIYAKAKEKEIAELLFLTREGAFIKQLFDIFNNDESMSAHIFYASRRSLLCASSDINWGWITQTFGSASVGFLLNAFHLDSSKYTQEVLSEKIENWKGIDEIKADMEKYSTFQRKILLDYIEGLIGLANKIGLIDVGWKGSSQYFLETIFIKENRKVNISGFYFGEFYDKRHENLDKTGYLCSTSDVVYKEAVLNAGFIFENVLSPEFGSTKEYGVCEGKIRPIMEKVNEENGEGIKIAQRAIIDYFKKYRNISKFCQHPSKDKTITMLFKSLGNPSYKMAEELGNISYIDFGKICYVAKPRSFFHYIMRPRDFTYDFKHCGWNSAFCRRCFKLPLPYFEIYKFLRRLMRVE